MNQMDFVTRTTLFENQIEFGDLKGPMNSVADFRIKVTLKNKELDVEVVCAS